MPDDEPARLLTIREAAAVAGMTPKAMRSRVDRGSLPAVLGHDGVRRIPRSELLRAGLIGPGEAGASPRNEADAPRGDLGALVDRIEHLARELGEARALAAQSDVRVDVERQAREAVERELHEARARVAELEAARGRRRWWQR